MPCSNQNSELRKKTKQLPLLSFILELLFPPFVKPHTGNNNDSKQCLLQIREYFELLYTAAVYSEDAIFYRQKINARTLRRDEHNVVLECAAKLTGRIILREIKETGNFYDTNQIIFALP